MILLILAKKQAESPFVISLYFFSPSKNSCYRHTYILNKIFVRIEEIFTQIDEVFISVNEWNIILIRLILHQIFLVMLYFFHIYIIKGLIFMKKMNPFTENKTKLKNKKGKNKKTNMPRAYN